MAPPSSLSLPKKAKHEANQEALDRLYVKYEQANQISGSKFAYTIKKAIKSVQSCPTAITTAKEAKALHGVGDSLARVIVKPIMAPSSTASLSRSNSVTSSVSANGVSCTATGTKARKRKDPPPPPPPPPPTAAVAVGDGKLEYKPSEKQRTYQAAVKASESLILPRNDWKVILLVDAREHRSEQVLAKLIMSGIPSEERCLPIGDMAWIARSGNVEVMLGTIIERKDVNDLASSLYGTRYKEQRLRLQHCGLPQVFLLVEGDTKDVANCPHDSLQMAMMETRVQLNFQVMQTRHLQDTVRFLKSVHRRILQRAFPNAFAGETEEASLPTFSSPSANRKRQRRRSIKKRDKNDRRSFEEMIFDTPPEPPFGANRFITYQELKAKVEKDREEGTKTLHAIFCGMLKQIPKVSNHTVPPLVHAYPTPDALFRALDGLNEAEGISLLSDLANGSHKVGEQKATEIYNTFMTGGDDSMVIEGVPDHSPTTSIVLPPAEEVKRPADISSPKATTTATSTKFSSVTSATAAAKEATDIIELTDSPIKTRDEHVAPSPPKATTPSTKFSPVTSATAIAEEATDIIELTDSPIKTRDEHFAPSPHGDDWDVVEIEQACRAPLRQTSVTIRKSPSKQQQIAARESLDSSNCLDLGESLRISRTSLHPVSLDSSEEDSHEDRLHCPLVAPRQSMESIDSFDMEIARMTKSKAYIPPASYNLSQSSTSTAEDFTMSSKSPQLAIRKGTVPSTPQENEDMMGERIGRLRDKLNDLKETLSPEFTISRRRRSDLQKKRQLSECNSPAHGHQPEVIDLID